MSSPAPPPPPAPTTPMPGSTTNMLGLGAESLAIRHTLMALLASLTKEQKAEFQKHLRAFQPKGQTREYIAVIADMVNASR